MTLAPSITVSLNFATGLINPVLEVFHSISSNVVSNNSSSYLYEMLCLKNLSVLPSELPYSISSYAITAPSYGISSSFALSCKSLNIAERFPLSVDLFV